MSEEWPWTWSPLPTSTRRIRDLEEELAQVQRTADERARQLSEQDKEIERLRTKVERFQFDKAQVLKADAKIERLRSGYCKQHSHLLPDMGCWVCRAQGAEAEVERLEREALSSKPPYYERWQKSEAEVERLRAEAEFHGKRAVEFATHIEAALELLESSDPPVYGLVVKAL